MLIALLVFLICFQNFNIYKIGKTMFIRSASIIIDNMKGNFILTVIPLISRTPFLLGDDVNISTV